ncbi:hypothetical protein M413DRAFT_442660, partial [Hebeloma cylindrosporum]
DSFRQLLKTPRVGASSNLGAASRSRGFVAPPPKLKVVDASQPAFKPRNVKKVQDSKYRDRAAERRVGDGNDYAHVEALLEDFEKRNAGNDDKDKVEAQRKYLGGDSEHSILVKGLDFALLEQNKAKVTISAEDVDALDQAFLQSSSSQHEPAVPKKRTREDIIRELKEQRAGKSSSDSSASKTSEELRSLEEAKQRGKFKPIGFKPIGSSAENKRKKPKTDNLEKEEKRKKRKANGDESTVDKAKPSTTNSIPTPASGTRPKEPLNPVVPEEPMDHDFDIFADAGEYEGIDIGDDDEEEGNLTTRPLRDDIEEGEEASTSSMPRRWISDDEPAPTPTSKNVLPLASMSKEHTRSSHREAISEVDEDMDSDEQPMRLAPLASSVLPSIKDLLAMDKAASSYDKKKIRKDKKSRGGGGDADDNEPKKKSLEEKVDRDYKRLKTYTDKKASSEKKRS